VPLHIYYQITSRQCTSGGSYLIKFWVWAEGGDGVYTYTRDIYQIGGPTRGGVGHELEWLECGGAVGTFFAEDESGQKTHRWFWSYPPDCCGK
jgi:hypothetical protein